MARIVWDQLGERLFEVGVSHGVLYPPDGVAGVAWNGLVAIQERSDGGSGKSYYYDGEKYANVTSSEDFIGTIEALYAPDEFEVCDGVIEVVSGLLITHQPRKPFGLCYKTMIGNDVDGVNHAYKLHLLYGLLASPSDKTFASLSDEIELAPFVWEVTAKPPSIDGYRATAHLAIDSRKADPTKLLEVESILYGDTLTVPRLPSLSELITTLTP